MTRAFYRDRQLALMSGAGSGHAARQDFRAFAHHPAEFCDILIVNAGNFIDTENTNLLALSASVLTHSFHAAATFLSNILNI